MKRVSSSVPSLEQRHGPVSRHVSVARRQRRDSGPWRIDLQVSRRPVVPSLFRSTGRYRDGRFAASKGNVLHKSGCSALSYFQLIDIFLLIWVPDAGAVFQLGTDDSFVSLFLQVLRTPIQSTSEKAQHAVCGSADMINVLVPAKSAVHRDSQIDMCQWS